MDRRSYLSSFASFSALPLVSSIGKNESSTEFYKTRESTRCVFGDDDYITGIRFYKLDAPYLRSCDPEEATRCIYSSTYQDYIGEVGQRLEYPTEFKFSEFDIYANLIRKADGFLVKQRGLGSASQGKEFLGWD